MNQKPKFIFIAVIIVMVAAQIFQGTAFSQSLGNTQFQINIDPVAHQKFGLYYPVTYIFQIPAGSSNLTAQYRFSQTDSWVSLVNKTSTDFFNGVNAARFDYVSNVVYVSVAFASNFDSIFVRVLNGSSEVPIEYLGIPQYYDNRRAVVTVTLDDFMGNDTSSFVDANQILAAARIHYTVGIETATSPDWAAIQQLLNSGYMEVASHSKTHPCTQADYVSIGYAYQIAGSRADILANLTLSHPYVPVYPRAMWIL